VYINVFVEICI